MRNGDLAAEGRAGPARVDQQIEHEQQREEEPTMWESPTLQGELANLIITERVRRARHRTTGQRVARQRKNADRR
jgi:hypothetical protein